MLYRLMMLRVHSRSVHDASIRPLLLAFMLCWTLGSLAPSATAATRTKSAGGVTVTLSVPDQCHKNRPFEASLDFVAKVAGAGNKGSEFVVGVYEQDRVRDDLVAQFSFRPPSNDAGGFSRRRTFTIDPRRLEVGGLRGRSLELYFKVTSAIQGLPGAIRFTTKKHLIHLLCR